MGYAEKMISGLIFKNPKVREKHLTAWRSSRWKGKVLSRFGRYSTDIVFCEICGKAVDKRLALGTCAGNYEKECVFKATYELCVTCYREYSEKVKMINQADDNRLTINRLTLIRRKQERENKNENYG